MPATRVIRPSGGSPVSGNPLSRIFAQTGCEQEKWQTKRPGISLYSQPVQAFYFLRMRKEFMTRLISGGFVEPLGQRVGKTKSFVPTH
jgi:hypothetical protein